MTIRQRICKEKKCPLHSQSHFHSFNLENWFQNEMFQDIYYSLLHFRLSTVWWPVRWRIRCLWRWRSWLLSSIFEFPFVWNKTPYSNLREEILSFSHFPINSLLINNCTFGSKNGKPKLTWYLHRGYHVTLRNVYESGAFLSSAIVILENISFRNKKQHVICIYLLDSVKF